MDEARQIDKIISVDLFVYQYATLVKNQPDEEDDEKFMARLRESLIAFKKQKATPTVTTIATTKSAFNSKAGSSSKIGKGVKRESKKKENTKVCTLIELFIITY